MLMIDHLNALPPAPDYPLDEQVLARRFDSEPWLAAWLGQQRDGPYWQRGSLRPGYGRLQVPAFLIGGWYDGYRDSVARMLVGGSAPVKVLIGPWNHSFPHDAVPGPAIEWRAEAVRWWDHWLRSTDTGIMAEPPVTVYVRNWHRPDIALTEIPGRWRAEDALPPERTRLQAWYPLGDGTLGSSPGSAACRQLRYVPSAGVEAGHWWGEFTVDQRGADAFSLTFDSAPLEEDVEILGFPRVEICGSVSAEPLHWFARLCDVAPDGVVTLVTGAGRSSAPDPLRDGAVESGGLPLELHLTSWTFPRGHRLRLALSNALWPMIWPTPHQAVSTVWLGPGATRLVLPVVPSAERPEPRFAEPAPAEPPPGVRAWGEMLPVRWRVLRDETGATVVCWRGASGCSYPWGRVANEEYLWYEVDAARPANTRAHGEARTEIHLADRLLIFSSVLDLGSDEEWLHYRFRRELSVAGQVLPEAGQLTLTPGQLRARLRRVVIAADPAGADERRRQAERRAEVRY